MRHVICTALVTLAAATTPALAQEPAPVLELQAGGSFLISDSELSHLASVGAGAVLWFSRSWGASLRHGMAFGERIAPYAYGDRIRTGTRNFHLSTLTLRYRRPLDTGLEFNFGIGLTYVSYDSLVWWPDGAPAYPGGGNVSGIGGIATEWLFGRQITPRLGIKAGLIVQSFFLDEATAFEPVGFAVVSF